MDGTNEAGIVGTGGIGEVSCGLDIGEGISAATVTAGGGITKDGGIKGGTIPGNGIVPARNGTVFTGSGGGGTVGTMEGGKGGCVSRGGGGGRSTGNGGGGASLVGGGGGGTFSSGGSIFSSFVDCCTLSSLPLISFLFSTAGFANDFVLLSDPLDDLTPSDLALDLLLLLGLIDLLLLLGLGERLLLLTLGERAPLLGLGDRLLLLGLGDRSLLYRYGEYLLFRRLALLLDGLGERLEYLLL